MPNVLLFALLQSSVVFGYFVYGWFPRLPWIPDVATIGVCSLPAAACVVSFLPALRKYASWIIGIGFLLVAFAICISGIVMADKFVLATGLFGATIAVFVILTDGRPGYWRGVPYHNFFFASVAAIIGLTCATVHWSHWGFNIAMAITTAAAALGFVLNRRWTIYCSTVSLLMISIASCLRYEEGSGWLTTGMLFAAMAAACPFALRELQWRDS